MYSSVLLAVAIWDASHVESLSLSRYDTPKTPRPGVSVRLIRLFVTRSSGPSSGAVDEHVQLASKYAHRCQFSSCYFNSEQHQQ